MSIQFCKGKILDFDLELKTILIIIQKRNKIFYLTKINFSSKELLKSDFTQKVNLEVLATFKNCFNLRKA